MDIWSERAIERMARETDRSPVATQPVSWVILTVNRGHDVCVRIVVSIQDRRQVRGWLSASMHAVAGRPYKTALQQRTRPAGESGRTGAYRTGCRTGGVLRPTSTSSDTGPPLLPDRCCTAWIAPKAALFRRSHGVPAPWPGCALLCGDSSKSYRTGNCHPIARREGVR